MKKNVFEHLPSKIETIEEAKAFLNLLMENNVSYHPEDDANEVLWDDTNGTPTPTPAQCFQLNELTMQIYRLSAGNKDLIFDPCEFLIWGAKEFMVKDLSGRGYTAKMDGNQVWALFEDDATAEELDDIDNYISSASENETFQTNNRLITCTTNPMA